MREEKVSRNRAVVGPSAERHATELAQRLGAALKDARHRAGLTQAIAARRAGLKQSTWSRLEVDRDPGYTLLTWDRAAFAVDARLDAFIRGGSSSDKPRDAVHLKAQELIIRTSRPGGWIALPEEKIDREARTSRAADVLLHRRPPLPTPAEYALMEVIDWFADVGAPMRDWSRRLEAVDRYGLARMRPDDPLPRWSGCWVVRATRRNRDLIAEHRNLFRSRFHGSGPAWLRALTDIRVPLPAEPSLLWVDLLGERLFPVTW
jgi:transcriptional regulator with XRE-family HTH domain